MASDEAPDGMDDDSDYDRKMLVWPESKKTKKPIHTQFVQAH